MTTTPQQPEDGRSDDLCLYCDTKVQATKITQGDWLDFGFDLGYGFCPKCKTSYRLRRLYQMEFYLQVILKFDGVFATYVNMIRVSNGLRPLKKCALTLQEV